MREAHHSTEEAGSGVSAVRCVHTLDIFMAIIYQNEKLTGQILESL